MGVLDEEALRRHIESGHLAGAAVDVFPQEPRGRGEEFTSQLRGLPNVILTPHIGGATTDTEARGAQMVADDLERLLAGDVPLHIVNPEVLGSPTYLERKR